MSEVDPIQLEPGISVVVPVYCSEATLDQLTERLGRVCSELGRPYEIVLVNDGSPDASWQQIERLADSNPRVVGINLTRNFGQHNALLCGIRAARRELIVTLDDDLQNPPEQIPKLLERLEQGPFDVVYGTPATKQHGLLRNLASAITRLALQSTMGAATARHVSAFRVFRTRLREAFGRYRSPMVSIDVLLAWGSTSFDAVAVEHEPRRHGRSNYTLGKLLVHAINMVTGFSTLPLQIASWIGFGMTLFGLAVLATVVTQYLREGTPVQGFPFLASIIAIFSGTQLFALGMIGEYLARMHWRAMDRPAYLVRQRCGTHVSMDEFTEPRAHV